MDPRTWLSIFLPDPPEDALARAAESLQRTSEPAWVATAVRERLGPLLYWRLTSLVPPVPVPEPVRRAFWESVSASALRTRWTGVLLAALTREGVVASPLKGAWLAASVYPGAALRPHRDPDVLVAPDDVQAAERALLSLGLAPQGGEAAGPRAPRRDAQVPDSHVSSCSGRFVDPEGRLSCRLHWGLANPSGPWLGGRHLLPLGREERGRSGTYLDLPASVHFLHLLLQNQLRSPRFRPLPRLLVDLGWVLARFGPGVAEQALELAAAFDLEESARRSLASLTRCTGRVPVLLSRFRVFVPSRSHM